MNFKELFKEISPDEMIDNVFALGKDFTVITAGKEEHYNAMIGSGGGLGILFKKPATWSIFRADRYTLEMIQKEKTYTVAYFSEEHRKQLLVLGNKSGRDSEKMKEVELTGMILPSGDMTFKEAKLVVECRLIQITTAYMEDLYSEEARDFIRDEYENKDYYRKYVFGEITHVWEKQ